MDSESNNISQEELARAFQPDEQEKTKKKSKKNRDIAKSGSKKTVVSLVVFVVGLITLIVGVVFLILRLNATPDIDDAERLIEVGSWTKEGAPEVIWTFTEVGKGTLTTNNHTNDYDFNWMIEDDRLLIQTDWLYTMDDEFQYTLEQGKNVLTLTPVGAEGDANIVFRPAVDV